MRQRFKSVGSEATGDAIRPFFLQSRKRGLQPALTPTHYSAGRVSAFLNMPPQTLSPGAERLSPEISFVYRRVTVRMTRLYTNVQI